MFNKLKQFKDLRDQAKTMQNALAGESISEEKDGIKISINGNLEITSISLNHEKSPKDQEEALKSCLNQAIKNVQKLIAKKLQEMGGIPLLN